VFVPLHYQVSEYDCVPTSFVNALCYLFERKTIPPMVVRHIFAYSLDTVSREARLGRAGTSRPAVRLMGHWLASYKTKDFRVATEYLEGEEVHLGSGSHIINWINEGGVALCNVRLSRAEEHFLLAVQEWQGWIYCFDPYYRTGLRGLKNRARILIPEDGRAPNLAVAHHWLDGTSRNQRFALGPIEEREVLLIRRDR
jgi:hypothetical protein